MPIVVFAAEPYLAQKITLLPDKEKEQESGNTVAVAPVIRRGYFKVLMRNKELYFEKQNIVNLSVSITRNFKHVRTTQMTVH